MQLSIGVVSNRPHNEWFKESYDDFMEGLFKNGQSYGLHGWSRHNGKQASNICLGRHVILESALEVGSTHLIGFDNDMKFPANCLEILKSRNVPFIGANYICKDKDEKLPTAKDLNGVPIDSTGKTGIEQVMEIGFGLYLLDLKFFMHKLIPPPYFEIKWDKRYKNNFITEDYFFCEVMRKYGMPIHVDHDLSNRVEHMGDYGYGFNSPLYKYK